MTISKNRWRTSDPANYMNKGADTNPDALASRVESLISYLMEKDSKAT